MRTLALSVAALAALVATAGTPAPAKLDATVVGPDGPVAGARVRMLALPAAPCPCTQSERALSVGSGNEVPECACPAALAQWRSRLARCDVAAGVVGELQADPQGRLRLEPPPGVTSLEASGPAGLLWMRWPAASSPIALSLKNPIQPTIQLTGAPPELIRGAVLFDDGHCVPIDRVGNAWRPRVPVPRFEAAGGTLIIEATGFATTVSSLFDQDQIDIALVPATPISGTCGGATVRLENPFQRLVVKVDDAKHFAITGALAITSEVSCWKDAKTRLGEWAYTPGEPLPETTSNLLSGSMSGGCTDVKVVDANNRRLADAEVSLLRQESAGYASGSSVSTDARGIACVEDFYSGSRLEVTAPQGRCAGETTVQLTGRPLAQTPLTVRLRVRPLKGTSLRGRVLAPDGSPVVGAIVAVRDLSPTNPNDCTQLTAAESGLDGTFSIASVPRGKVMLEIDHPWFAKRELTVEHDGSAHDVVLPRGERWSGRLLDPEGAPIDDCSISLQLAGGRTLYARCKAGAFELKPIAPGEARLRVRLENHALGTSRSLNKKVQLAAGARGDDLQFARGEPISGRVVDARGVAIPRAQLTAIPKGASRPPNRLHDEEVQVEADPAGRFTFRHLTPGTWTLSGIGRTYTQASIDVATGTTDVTFVVPAR